MASLIEHTDGANGNGNRKSISVEICRPTNANRSLYDQAEENAVYVVARLLYKFGLGIDRLKKHQDWSGKKCPNVILGENRWESFKDRVRWVLEEIKKGNIDESLESGTTGLKTNKPVAPSTPTVDTTPTTSIQVGDSVKVNTTATKYATVDKAIPDYVKGSTYTVSKVDNDKALLKEITSWVYTKDVAKVGATTSQIQTQETFKVKVICDSLNIRKSDSFDSAVVGEVSKGEVFTIVEESNGLGLLKSYATNCNGWISMGSSYVQKI